MEKMKAAVLVAPGVIEVQEIDIPEITADEVLIKVTYTGICGSDLPRTQNENGARKYPLVIGHEFSGTVAKVGENVKNLPLNTPVCVAPLIPDPESIYTKEGLYGLSDNYNIIGTGSNGGMAEYVKVPIEHVVPIPNSLSLLDAAGVEPAAISFHALRKSNIQAGDKVAVLGCGPIGQFAVQCAKIFGASEIIAVDIFQDKLNLAKELGATSTINSKENNLIDEIMKQTGIGVDVVIETAGSVITQEQALNIARKNGSIVFVGISHQDLHLKASSVEKILRGELTVNGAWNSYTAPYPGRDWEGTLAFMDKKEIVFQPMISHHISLEELGDYLTKMHNKTIEFNKVIVDVNPE